MFKNKQAVKLIVLIVILALLGGTYYFVDKKKAEEEKTDEAEEQSISLISDVTAENITKLVFKSKISKEECSFEYNSTDKKWTNATNKDWNINGSLIDSMISGFVSLSATEKLETTEDKSTYGFDDPTVTFTFSTADKEYKGNIGSAIPTMDAYYCSIDGDDSVYIIKSDFEKLFEYTKKQLVEVETLPVVDANSVYYALLDNKTGKDIEVVYDGKKEDTKTTKDWYITKPYGVKQIGDAQAISEFFGTFASLTYKEFVDSDKSNWSKYGLDKPSSTLLYKYYTQDAQTDAAESTADPKSKETTDEAKTTTSYHTFKLYVGTTVELDTDGDSQKENYYYVKSSDSDNVYLMLADNIEGFTKTNISTCVSTYVNNNDLLKYKDLTIQIGSEKYVWSETFKETKAEATKEPEGTAKATQEPTNTITYYYKLNGKEVDTTNAASLYSNIMNLTTQGLIKDKVEDTTPVATFIYTAQDENDNVVVKYLPYNSNFYRVNKNGGEYFLVPKSNVDKVLEEIKNFGK